MKIIIKGTPKEIIALIKGEDKEPQIYSLKSARENLRGIACADYALTGLGGDVDG